MIIEGKFKTRDKVQADASAGKIVFVKIGEVVIKESPAPAGEVKSKVEKKASPPKKPDKKK